MIGHWFVIASQSTARVFKEIPEEHKLSLLKIFDNPLGPQGLGLRYSQIRRQESYEGGAAQFAKQLAQFLHSERHKKNFNFLTVVAEPHFLGKIRKALHVQQIGQLSIQWINKGLQKTPTHRLSKILLAEADR